MTNAEKYLKDGSSRQFLTEFSKWYYSKIRVLTNSDTVLAQFLAEKTKPTLTEEERAILKNLHEEYKTIKRNSSGYLYVGVDYFGMYDNIFQFIKNGEEYSIEELLK